MTGGIVSPVALGAMNSVSSVHHGLRVGGTRNGVCSQWRVLAP